MSVKQIRRVIFMFVLGLILIALDVYAKTGIEYPEKYQNDEDIIGEYQYYSIDTFYGATCTYTEIGYENVDNTATPDAGTNASGVLFDSAEFVDEVFFDRFRLDIFNDVVGLLLVAIACFTLSKHNSVFRLAGLLATMSIIMKGILTALPFFLNGMPLCNIALGVGTSCMLATIITSFFGARGFINLIQDHCCRDERIWMNTTWIISAVIIILIYLLTWLNLYGMAYFFTAVLIMDYLLFGVILKRTDEFIVKNCNA